MFDVGESLRASLEGAQSTLLQAQSQLARSGAGGSGSENGAVMAQTARAALFEEALLNAEHARLAEVKAVAR